MSPEYKAWANMKDRCLNTKRVGYHNYGGRGIAVCAEWLTSFESFYAHIGPKPTPEHTLDRYPNNDGNYEPGNVRWATMAEQMRNRRAGYNGTSITIDGVTLCVAEWAKISGIKPKTLALRIKNKWPFNQELLSAADPHRPKRRHVNGRP